MSDPKAPIAPAAPITVTPDEIIAGYESIGASYDPNDPTKKNAQWNPHLSAWRNPNLVTRTLWAYGKATAGRVRDAFRRIVSIEARLDALEGFRAEMLATIAEGEKQMEAAMRAGTIAALPVPTAPSAAMPKNGHGSEPPVTIPLIPLEMATPLPAPVEESAPRSPKQKPAKIVAVPLEEPTPTPSPAPAKS